MTTVFIIIVIYYVPTQVNKCSFSSIGSKIKFKIFIVSKRRRSEAFFNYAMENIDKEGGRQLSNKVPL